jgi:hypothetical protein
MILDILEWVVGGSVYTSVGAAFARTQSKRCWKAAKRRFNETKNQEQGWRELIAIRVLLWPLYLPGRVIIKICEQPVVAAQAELAETKAALAQWTDDEKFAVDDRSEMIARAEKRRLTQRILELEA